MESAGFFTWATETMRFEFTVPYAGDNGEVIPNTTRTEGLLHLFSDDNHNLVLLVTTPFFSQAYQMPGMWYVS